MKSYKTKQNEIVNFLQDSDIEPGNGYVKFPDGTAICYGWRHFTNVSIGLPWGNIFYVNLDDNFTFPVTFTESPTILLTTQQENIIGATIRLYRRNSFPNVTVTSAQRIENIPDVFIYYIVIGRWK